MDDTTPVTPADAFRRGRELVRRNPRGTAFIKTRDRGDPRIYSACATAVLAIGMAELGLIRHDIVFPSRGAPQLPWLQSGESSSIRGDHVPLRTSISQGFPKLLRHPDVQCPREQCSTADLPLNILQHLNDVHLATASEEAAFLESLAKP